MRAYKDLLKENRKIKKQLSKNIEVYREYETSWENITRLNGLILREEIKQHISILALIVGLSALWSFNDFLFGKWIFGTIWFIIGSLWGFMLVSKIKQFRKLKK